MTPAKLKEKRLRLGLKTHQSLAEALGIPKQTVDSWSTGRRKIPAWVKGFLECLEGRYHADL
jgi:DNA-binding transcriptional regulator YiaG